MSTKNIKGITIEFNGVTVKLNKALQSVEKYGKDLEKQMKDVDKALQLDPTNTELLSQKQRILADQIDNTKERLDLLRQAEAEAAKSVGNYDEWKAAYEPIQKEIDKTKKKITELQAEQLKLQRAGKTDTEEYQHLSEEIDSLKGNLKDLHAQSEAVNEQFGSPISTEEFEKLQIEISVTEAKLKSAQDALGKLDVSPTLRIVQNELKKVNKALELNPKNVTLLNEKQNILSESIAETKNKLKQLEEQQEKVTAAYESGDIDRGAYLDFQTEIEKTRKELEGLEEAAEKNFKRISDATEPAKQEFREVEEAVQSARDELEKVDDALEYDPSNISLLTEKHNILGEAIVETRKKLEQLEDQQKEITAAYAAGDIDRGAYLDFRKEVEKTRKELKELETIAEKNFQEIADATDPAKREIREIGDAIEDVEKDAADFGDILKADAIVEGAGRILDSIKDVSEETKEYRKIMGSLEVSSEAAGYTTEQTEEGYKRLFGVLADEQSSATALANLQALGLEQDKLLQLIDASIGGWAKYGDSIPIDGLAEAINETIKTGQVTGTFADILNWGSAASADYGQQLKDLSDLEWNLSRAKEHGFYISDQQIEQMQKELGLGEVWGAEINAITDTRERQIAKMEALKAAGEDWNNSLGEMTAAEDQFNAALQQCATNEERVALVMKALTEEGLPAAAEKWRENNASMVASNEANADLQEQMAELGEVVEPFATMFTKMLTEALSWFNGLDSGTQKFIVSTVALTGGLAPLAGALNNTSGIFKLLTKTDIPDLSKAFDVIKTTSLPGLKSAFSTTMSFIAANPIVALIAAVAGLVTWIAIDGDKIQESLHKVDDYVQGVFAKDWTETFGPVLGGVMNSFMDDLKNWWDSGVQLFNGIIDFIRGTFTGDWDRAWSGIKDIFGGALNSILALAGTDIEELKSAFSNGSQNIKNFFANANWQLPKIKLPHFSVTGSFSFGPPPTVPRIGVQWYAKGGILDGAQIFGRLGNMFLGGGEAGKEAVLPLDSFYEHLEKMFDRILGESYTGIRNALSQIAVGTNQTTIISLDSVNPGIRDLLSRLAGSSGAGRSVTVQVSIDHFENNTDSDLDELTDQISERIEFKMQQKEAALT